MANTTKILSPEYLGQDRGPALLRVTVIFTVLEVVFVFLFFTSRIRTKTANNLDTYLMIPAFLFNFCLIGELYYDVAHKISGRHVEVLPKDHMKLWQKAAIFASLMYLPSVMFPKLSILYLYLRIFSKKIYRVAAYLIATVLVLNCVIGWILGFIQCVPFRFTWDKSVQGGWCIDQIMAYAWISFPNIITDVAMLILPLPIIWNLQTTRNQKIGLTITFATFSAGLVTSILRFSVVIRTNVYEDISWYGTNAGTWNVTEAGMYLIAACLPSVRALLVLIFERINSRFCSEKRTRDDGERKRSTFGRSHGVITPVDMELDGLSRGNDRSELQLVTCYHLESVPEIYSEGGSGEVLERVGGIQVSRSYGLSSGTRVA